jgi:hypothetical protein
MNLAIRDLMERVGVEGKIILKINYEGMRRHDVVWVCLLSSGGLF